MGPGDSRRTPAPLSQVELDLLIAKLFPSKTRLVFDDFLSLLQALSVRQFPGV